MEALIREVAAFGGDLVRNIKNVRVSQDLFDDLAKDPADRDVAIAAESATRMPSAAPLITRPFDYGAVVTYPFVPHNWQATRYSDGLAYGVWYGALELETTVYETVYHWHRFVMDSFAGLDRAIAGERRVFSVRCDAILIDLRAAGDPRLTDRRDYSFTWQVGRYLWERSQSGLLARSARAAGTSAALFRPEALSDVRDLCFLTYRMNPVRDRVGVERTPGTAWLEVKPSTLA
ncbi:MAG TPA: RES family NAD+ phosphorylase [Burkholderiales bacterium]